MLGRGTGGPALPLQLASLSFSLYKEERANQREIKVHVPQRTSRRGGRKGKVVGERGRSREKALRPKQKSKPANPKDQTVETHDRKRAGHVGRSTCAAKEERE